MMEEDLDGLPEDAISINVDSSSSDEETTAKQEIPRQRPFNSPKLSFSDDGSDDEAMEIDPPEQINQLNNKSKSPIPLLRKSSSPDRKIHHSRSRSPSPNRRRRHSRSRSPSPNRRRRHSRSRSPSPNRRRPHSRSRTPSSNGKRHRSRSKSPVSNGRRHRSRSVSHDRRKRHSRQRSPSPDRRRYRSRSRSPNHRPRTRSPGYRKRSPSRSRSVEKNYDKFSHFRKRRSRSRSYDGSAGQDRKEKEEKQWIKIRSEREKYGAKGIENVWSRSPTESDLIDIYKQHEKAEKAQKHEQRKMELEEKERRKDREKAEKKKLQKEKLGLVADSASESDKSSSDSDSDEKKKKKRKEKKKKHKKEKKSSKKHHKKKKKRKRHHSSSSEDESDSEDEKHKKKKSRKSEKTSENEQEWVPVTKEMKKEEEQKAKEEELGIIGPAIPEHLIKNVDEPMAEFQFKNDASMKKDMLRGEAEAMAAYIAQGKRIPRRGEIGLSSDEITSFEKVGYVMSGTRHKAMEATRLRKENQIMTAEEKRMLSGFTHEQRKQKEDVVLQRMRSLIDSKKSKE